MMVKMKKIKFFIWEILTVSFLPTLALAAAPSTDACGSGEFWSIFANGGSGGCISSYEEWISLVWNWGLKIVIPLGVLVIAIAGVIYMTSGGNENRVALAKRIAGAAIAGIAVLILGKVILNMIGVGNKWNV